MKMIKPILKGIGGALLGLLLGYPAPILFILAPFWLTAHNVSSIEHRSHTVLEQACAVLLAPWYNAFKIAKMTPYRRPDNAWKHDLGKILVPNLYSAFQLAKINNPKVGTEEKLLSLLIAPAYCVYGSSKLAERNALGLAPAARLNTVSYAPTFSTPPTTCYRSNPTPSLLIQKPMSGMYTPTL